MPSFSKNPGSMKSNHLFKVSLRKNTMLALKLISRTIDQPLTVDSQVKKHYFCTCRDPSKLIENFFDLPKNYLPKTKLMSFIHTCTCTQSVELIMPPRSRFTQLQNACLFGRLLALHCTLLPPINKHVHYQVMKQGYKAMNLRLMRFWCSSPSNQKLTVIILRCHPICHQHI